MDWEKYTGWKQQVVAKRSIEDVVREKEQAHLAQMTKLAPSAPLASATSAEKHPWRIVNVPSTLSREERKTLLQAISQGTNGGIFIPSAETVVRLLSPASVKWWKVRNTPAWTGCNTSRAFDCMTGEKWDSVDWVAVRRFPDYYHRARDGAYYKLFQDFVVYRSNSRADAIHDLRPCKTCEKLWDDHEYDPVDLGCAKWEPKWGPSPK